MAPAAVLIVLCSGMIVGREGEGGAAAVVAVGSSLVLYPAPRFLLGALEPMPSAASMEALLISVTLRLSPPAPPAEEAVGASGAFCDPMASSLA